MNTFHGDLETRCAEYCRRYQTARIRKEGSGTQGVVFFTDRTSAVKVFMRENHYKNERDVYLRLDENNVSNVCGFDVPELYLFDNDLWAIEMSVVPPPFLLDFASAYLDEPPDYPDEVVVETQAKHAEIFGDDWPAVRMAVSALERFGIYMIDLHLGNIRCHEPDEE